MPTEIEIDIDRLRELASDPNRKTADVHNALGMSSGTFYTKLNKDPELKQIFTEGRAAAREAKGLMPKSAKRPGKRASKKSAAPPRNGNAKAHKELFKKMLLEFDHIEVYGAVSEHFDELREEIRQQ